MNDYEDSRNNFGGDYCFEDIEFGSLEQDIRSSTDSDMETPKAKTFEPSIVGANPSLTLGFLKGGKGG